MPDSTPSILYSDAQFRLLVQSVTDYAIYALSPTGIVTSWNAGAERAKGYTASDIVGQPYSRFFTPEDQADDKPAHALVTARVNGRFADEGWRVRKDGTRFWASVVIDPILDENNQLVGFAKITHDMTQRHLVENMQATLHALSLQAQREAEVSNLNLLQLTRNLVRARDTAEGANRAKSRFLAGMSHELRTPLNGILGYAHLLRMEGGLSPSQAARVDAMLTAGTHLLQMITRVLDLAEIEAEHVELRMAKFDLQAVLVECVDVVRPAAEAKGLALSVAMAPDTQRELVADPTRLRQVLLNLLGNAVKFTSHGSVELRLRSVSDGSWLRIEVADTGPGISAKNRQRLFRDFERLETEVSSTAEGIGLGLALSAGLVTLMGGRLGHDDNPGGGSVFWLELPLDAVALTLPAMAQVSDVQDPDPLPARALHVLVVDDIAMNRDIADSFLRAAGHTVTCVEGGAEAVAAVATTDFDVVLMDVRMPEMDGLEATLRIRALDGVRGRVPIVAVTAQAFTDQIAECRNAGMDSHLAKPFNPDTLVAAVARAAAAGPAQGQRPSPATLPTTTVPTAPVVPITDAEEPVIDPEAFERTAIFLPHEAVARYLKTIVERSEGLLSELREPDALIRIGHDLALSAHTLAGSAGMFGFQRLAAVGLRFERAIQSGAPEALALADRLSTVLEATVQEIHNRTLAVDS